MCYKITDSTFGKCNTQRVKILVMANAHWRDHWEKMGKSDSNGRTPILFDFEISTDVDSKLSFRLSDFVLNIGCGTGILEKGFPNNFIISIDFASSMLKHAWIVNGIRASASRLPFRDASFDKMCVYSIVQYLRKDELSLMLRDISRCLKDGGKCLIGDIPLNGSWYESIRHLIGKIVLENHFEYHSVKWMTRESEKLSMNSSLLVQPENLPFCGSRKDLLLIKK